MSYITEYIVGYDIEDNKIRNKIFEKLKDFGLIPIQKSIFFGALSKAELNSIKTFLKQTVPEKDKVIVIQGEILKQIKEFNIGYNLEAIDIYKEWKLV